LPESLAEIIQALEEPAAIQEEAAEARAQGSRVAGSIAVIPVYGPIQQRDDLFSLFFGGISTERLSSSLRQMLADPAIGTIVLDMDSPGGSVFGVPELADEIFQARGSKRIVAVANSWAASAAYWIASQADEVVVTPSGQVGSIGVYALHEDWSKYLDNMGVKLTAIRAGKFKTEGSWWEPLSEEAQQAVQKEVNAYYDLFVKAVGRGRGVKSSEVKSQFGEGRMVLAKEAVELGMADRVATLDETLSRLAGTRRGARAEEEMMAPVADLAADKWRLRLLELED